jgi:hypothetical protein
MIPSNHFEQSLSIMAERVAAGIFQNFVFLLLTKLVKKAGQDMALVPKMPRHFHAP